MERSFKFFSGLIVCTLVIAVPLLWVSGGWWAPALPPMVVRELNPPPPPNPMQLTANSGSNVDPAWSPDNWHLAFASNRSGSWCIWTMCEDGTKQQQLTANNTISRYPAWSPDGGRIAYLSYVEGQWDLWVMRADGTYKTKLANGPVFEAAPKWSPDGKLILFTKQHPNWNVWVTCGDGFHQAQLTTKGTNRYPSWCPEGKRIVYSFKLRGNWDVWMMNADGTNQTQLTKDAGNNIKPQPSPDGKQIIFLSDRRGLWHIYSTIFGEWFYPPISGVAEDADPAFSPDGENVVFHSRWADEHGILVLKEKENAKTIFMMSANPTSHSMDLVAISTYPGAKMGASNEMQTSWSPDSGKIAFVSDRSGNLDIWLLNLKGFTVPVEVY